MNETDPAPASTPAKPNAVCAECGASYHAKRKDASDFCSTKCRAAFNNRRAMRGAEMYDLMMALRNDREVATKLGVWKIMCRIAAEHRADDVAQRGGRKSWRNPKEVIARRPYLTVATVSVSTKKKG